MTIEPKSLELLATVLEPLGYTQFSAPGDRHGSWEWPFYRTTGGLTRFVIFTATPTDGRSALQVEIWIGAQSDAGFVRRLVYKQRISAREPAGFVGDLTEQARNAVIQANALRSSDLITAPLSPSPREDSGFATPARAVRR